MASFPSTPAVGDNFVAYGTTYVFTGDGWIGISSGTSVPAHTANDHVDIDTISVAPNTGDHLTWSGSNWTPSSSAVESITVHNDVDTVSVPPTTGQQLQWDGAAWIPGDGSSNQYFTWANGTGILGLRDTKGFVQIDLDGRYLTADAYSILSPATVGPTTRLDGSAVQPGDLYFNTASNVYQVYHSGIWSDITLPSSYSISNLTDADTVTAPPAIGDSLVWNGTNWVPSSSTAGTGAPITLPSSYTEPTTRTDGTALQAGDLFFHTSVNLYKVFHSGTWSKLV